MAHKILGDAWKLLRATGTDYWDDNVSRLSAALAFYTVFAVAPLLVIGVKVAGAFFGQQRSRHETDARLRQLLGKTPADAVQSMLDRAAAAHSAGTWSAVAGGAVLVYIATTLFTELQDSMNTIWEVEASRDRTWKQTIYDRLGPFLMVIGTWTLSLIAVAAAPLLDAFGPHLGGPPWVHLILRIAGLAIAFSVIAGTIFKVLPDVHIDWTDVLIGAGATGLLFTAGELLLEWYLGRPGVTSIYGTVGSLAILLLWVYYSAQVLFLGAEFTQVYARQIGHGLTPERGAVRIQKRRRGKRPDSQPSDPAA
jgi:membrane protein